MSSSISLSSSFNGVKSEPGIGAGAGAAGGTTDENMIYEDDSDVSMASLPEGEEGKAGEDSDVYEDSGDLDLHELNTKVWLVRMPKFLRDKWMEMDSDGQDLGTIRLRQDNTNDIRLILSDSPATFDLPHEYKLAITNQNVSNTFVFTEQNLARFNNGKAATGQANGGVGGSAAGGGSAVLAGGRPSAAPMTAGQAGVDSSRGGRFSSKRRYQPYNRVNIPKKTALVGTVFHECSLAVSPTDKNYKNFLAQRRKLTEAAPREQVTLLTEIPGITAALAGPNMKDSNSMFMRAQKRDKERIQEGKAARISRNELLDLLFKLFEDYDYWTMKGLRERTRQPEAFLKEVLGAIAILNKKGPYALKYSLKPEYKGRRQDIPDVPEVGVNGYAPPPDENY
ncbi:transcription initiation factor IIF, beta subunit-domain-containing protein [Limtongia smithiae]|uniref:transcription initiation factor IIF, beta subunit-domain-containing protein n=1 Tax=Limtongia smithiae TaxID=1125753 RepID=UPI0034CD0901